MLFVVNMVRHFAFAQIGHHFTGHIAGYAKSDAKTRATGIEPENQPRLIGSSTMNVRVDAQTASVAVKARAHGLHMRKTRPPHQRAVAENPEIVHPPIIEECGHESIHNDLVNADFHW